MNFLQNKYYEDINIKEVIKNYNDYLIIDVRSPIEFSKDYLYGSINISLLNDRERYLIGIIFKNKGFEEALKYGKKLILPFIEYKLNKIYNNFIKSKKKKILIYCSRGGSRSKIISNFLILKIKKIYRLIDGYKSYRKMIVSFFEKEKMPKLKVFYGLTGSGKTDLLIDLKNEGYPIIDLENLANHRGSVFGNSGLGIQPTQKFFESMLFFELINKEKYYIIEGESKKIGKISIPKRFYEKIEKGEHYLITASLKERIKRIKKYYSYISFEEKEKINISLNYLKRRLGNKIVNEIKNFLKLGKINKAIEILLINYYDILYKKNIKNYIKKFSTTKYKLGLNKIKNEFK